MAAGLMQAPLPWLPEGATEIARGVGLAAGEDGSGVVWVHGLATFCWDAGDEASRKLAAVQLAELKAATQKQVAAGFGTTPVTVWRWISAYREHGLAGLLPERKGPKGPSKLTPELAEEVRRLAADGLPQRQVAQRCGVSEFTVRAVLGRVPSRREAAARLAAHDAAEPEPAASAWEQEQLPVLPDPVPRETERALARFGLLGEGAAPVFAPAARVPYAGLLLALPALAATGLLGSARGVYGRLRNGFYGLETMLVLLVFLALLREPRAEGATRVPPAALGRVLGLDRAPEVKTIRRKLGELAAAGKAADLQLAIARHHAATRPDDLGFLYIDGHTRAYFGTREVQKTHVARLKFPSPATEETWVTGQSGDPLLVVIGEPSDSLAARIKDLLPALRGICGEHAKPVLCFDRGGWSLDLFAAVIAAGFGLLTYRKNASGKTVPDLAEDTFTAVTWAGDDGRERAYQAAESRITLTVPSGEHKGEELDLRQVTRRDKGRQVHILTTAGKDELPPGAVVYRMTRRWREENWFRYGRAHFALDSLDSYATVPDTPGRKVPNPAKKTASAAVQAARKALADAEDARQAKLGKLKNPAPGQQITITNAMLARLDAPVEAARRKLAQAQAAARQVPAKIPLAEHNPDMVRLETEAKLITHAVKMAAYNAETILARALHGRYARADDQAYALIREALHASGDIIPGHGTLTIRLSPLSAPRRTRAIAALCDQLNDARVCYPGTSLTLRFEVKDHPATT
ncbi:MAG TPA: helix-turn-helix domain-containing protein [Streptosporangiaceae bacterium]|nr:helix-turn-helix domain-containing protein [Streptosporangiaceae bacterium]